MMPRHADPSTKPLVHEQQASAKYILQISAKVSANWYQNPRYPNKLGSRLFAYIQI